MQTTTTFLVYMLHLQVCVEVGSVRPAAYRAPGAIFEIPEQVLEQKSDAREKQKYYYKLWADRLSWSSMTRLCDGNKTRCSAECAQTQIEKEDKYREAGERRFWDEDVEQLNKKNRAGFLLLKFYLFFFSQ